MSEISNIQKQIKSVLEEFKSLQNVKAHLDETEAKLATSYNKMKALDKMLDKELKDIEKLEKLGIKSLFHKALGSKEEQLEKERQEYLEASLQYKESKKSVELMEFERDLLAKKINSLPKIQAHLEELKKARAQEIMNSSNITVRNEFSEIIHKLDIGILLNKELEEAIDAGVKSNKLLGIVASFLRKAGEWGRWDMYGDNRRAGYMKQQAIDKAIRNLSQAQHQLNMFTRELKDLGENNIQFKLNMVHFSKFTDFFFDNLISDWIIQQRIKSTLNNIESTNDHVKRIVLSLQSEQKENFKKIADLEVLKDQLILS